MTATLETTAQTIVPADLIRTDEETSSFFVVPVLLRDLNAAGVELDSTFGSSDAEAAELLTDPTILQLRFGKIVDEDYELQAFVDVECLQSTLSDPEPDWTSCLRRYQDRYVSGHRSQIEMLRNFKRVWDVLRATVPDWSRRIEECGAVHEEWLAAQHRESDPQAIDDPDFDPYADDDARWQETRDAQAAGD